MKLYYLSHGNWGGGGGALIKKVYVKDLKGYSDDKLSRH